MADAVHTPGRRCPHGIVTALCLLSCGVSTAAQPPTQPISPQLEQQRRAQTEVREALERSERRIAADQAEQIRQAEERAGEQRRAMAEADRRREAEQHREELLAQARARAQQSDSPHVQDAIEVPQSKPQESAAALPPTSVSEPLPRQYSLMRETGFVVMIGASLAALFVLGRIVRESRDRRRFPTA